MRRLRGLAAAVICGCLVAIGAAPESGATTLRKVAKPTVHRAKQPPRSKCRVMRRRQGRKLVAVKVCPKPAQRKTTLAATGSSRASAQAPAPATGQTRAPTAGGTPAPTAGGTPAPSTGLSAPSAAPITTYPGGTSAWDEPALVNPTTVVLSDSARSLKLDQSKDYIVTCPPGQFDVSGKITIWGGHNVVFENCDEYVDNPAGDWAGYLENQTGTLWVHDVHFGGAAVEERRRVPAARRSTTAAHELRALRERVLHVRFDGRELGVGRER